MSYSEILMSVIVIGMISVSLVMGIKYNNKSGVSINKLSTAIEVAKNALKAHMIGEAQPQVEGYTIEKDTTTYDELVKVTVKWKVGSEQNEYTLYGTQPNNLYN